MNNGNATGKTAPNLLTHRLVQGVALFVLTLVVFAPAIRNGYIWDDDAYVHQNPLLQEPGGLARIWFEPTSTPQYYPLVHTSYWIEYRLWGLDPAGYHAVNLLLHAGAALILWQLLRRLVLPGSWMIAALFAIHPVQVESVAWIAERKNVLSGILAMAAAWAYVRFLQTGDDPAAARTRHRRYALALVCFVLALLSKTVAAMLPLVLLLLMWWKQERITLKDVTGLAPFFVLGGVMATVTIMLERQHVGAVGREFDLSFAERLLVAGRAAWFYPGKIVFPFNLSFMYTRWEIDTLAWWQYLFPGLVAMLLLVLGLTANRLGRGPLAAVCCFLALVFPALGFFNVYPHRFSFVADHFQYLACIPVIVILVQVIWRLAARLGPQRLAVSLGLGTLVLAGLSILTWQQLPMYENSETLYRATLEKNPAAWMACNNLGYLLLDRGDTWEARKMFERCLEIEAAQIDRHSHLSNIGLCYASDGNWPSAVAYYRQALELRPDYGEGHANLGMGLLRLNQPDEALASLRRATELRPDRVGFHVALADALATQEQFSAAVLEYQRALQLDPDNAGVLFRLSRAFVGDNQLENAVSACQHAILIQSDRADWVNQLSLLLFKVGRVKDAMLAAQEAYRLAESHGAVRLAEQIGARIREYQRVLRESGDAVP